MGQRCFRGALCKKSLQLVLVLKASLNKFLLNVSIWCHFEVNTIIFLGNPEIDVNYLDSLIVLRCPIVFILQFFDNSIIFSLLKQNNFELLTSLLCDSMFLYVVITRLTTKTTTAIEFFKLMQIIYFFDFSKKTEKLWW